MKHGIPPKVSTGLRLTGSCGQNSLRGDELPVCACNFPSRAGKIRFVRTFSAPCVGFPVRAGNLPARASQLPVRAAIFPSVRPFIDLCGPKPRYLTVFGEFRQSKSDSWGGICGCDGDGSKTFNTAGICRQKEPDFQNSICDGWSDYLKEGTKLDRLSLRGEQRFNWDYLNALLEFFLMSDAELEKATKAEGEKNGFLKQFVSNGNWSQARRNGIIPSLCSCLDRFSVKP